MSLLKITTTPIEYEIKIERAKLRAKELDFQDIQNSQAEQARKQRLAEYKVDPTVVKKAEGAAANTANYTNVAKMRAGGTVKATPASQLSLNSSQNVIGDLSTAVSEASAEGYTESIDFASSFSDGGFDVQQFVNSSSADGVKADSEEWTVSKKEMEYVPGRFQMDIIQYPKVTIEYLGDENSEN